MVCLRDVVGGRPSIVDDAKTRIEALTPSPCIAAAVSSFKGGLDKIHQSIEELLDWQAAGKHGDPPGYEAALEGGSLYADDLQRLAERLPTRRACAGTP